MKFPWLVALLVLHFCFSPLVLAQGGSNSELTDEEIELFYGLFKEVDRFGLISLTLIGSAEKIGLNEESLTKYLDEKFRACFCNTKYEDLTQNPAKLAAAIAKRDNKIGIITFRVWVIGEDYPLAYHVRCDAGTFENPSIWTEEVLGHGSKSSAPGAIQEIINELMQVLAENFLKARGDDCIRKF